MSPLRFFVPDSKFQMLPPLRRIRPVGTCIQDCTLEITGLSVADPGFPRGGYQS